MSKQIRPGTRIEHGSGTDSRTAKHTLKCVFLGSSGTGKSSIIQQYMVACFNPYTVPTIGAAFNAKYIPTKNIGVIKLEIWDTAGQERFESLIPMYYRGAKIAFVVYDITSHESFIKAKNWVSKIKKELPIPPLFILVGNKTDMGECRAVSTIDAKRYADEQQILFKECSAKTGHNINNLFEEAYTVVVEQIHHDQSVKIDIPDPDRSINLEEESKSSGISGCFGTVLNPLLNPLYGLYNRYGYGGATVTPVITDGSSDSNTLPV